MEGRAEELVHKLKTLKADVNSKHQEMSNIVFNVKSLEIMNHKIKERYDSLNKSGLAIDEKQDRLSQELEKVNKEVLKLDVAIEEEQNRIREATNYNNTSLYNITMLLMQIIVIEAAEIQVMQEQVTRASEKLINLQEKIKKQEVDLSKCNTSSFY